MNRGNPWAFAVGTLIVAALLGGVAYEVAGVAWGQSHPGASSGPVQSAAAVVVAALALLFAFFVATWPTPPGGGRGREFRGGL